MRVARPNGRWHWESRRAISTVWWASLNALPACAAALPHFPAPAAPARPAGGASAPADAVAPVDQLPNQTTIPTERPARRRTAPHTLAVFPPAMGARDAFYSGFESGAHGFLSEYTGLVQSDRRSRGKHIKTSIHITRPPLQSDDRVLRYR